MLFLIKLKFSWKKKWFFNYFFDSEKSKWSRTSQFFRCNYLGPGRGSPTRTISASNMAVWINQSGWRPTLRKLTHSSVPLSVQRRTPLAKSAFKGLTRNILLITSLMENVLIPRGKSWTTMHSSPVSTPWVTTSPWWRTGNLNRSSRPSWTWWTPTEMGASPCKSTWPSWSGLWRIWYKKRRSLTSKPCIWPDCRSTWPTWSGFCRIWYESLRSLTRW